MAQGSDKAVIAEVLIIVFGVLIALFAENEWGEFQARRQAGDYIRRLAVEVEANQSVAENESAWMSHTCEAAETLLAEFRADDSDADHLWLLHLAVAAMVHRGYQFRRSTFDDLVETGSLALIDETELREQVVETYTFLEAHRVWRPAIESPFRTAVIGVLPTEFIQRVAAECVYDDGRISSDLANLSDCDVEPREGSADALLDRLRGQPRLTEELSVRAWTVCNYAIAPLANQLQKLALSLDQETD